MSHIGVIYIEQDTKIGIFTCRGNPTTLGLKFPKGSLILNVDDGGVFQSNSSTVPDWGEVGSGGTGGGGGFLTPSYSNPLGSGYRRKEIVITSTGGNINGDPHHGLWPWATNVWFWSTSSAARSMTFQFPVPVRMTGITFLQDNATANGSWQMAGSNDNATWTNLGAPFNWGGAAESEGLFDNEEYYEYYRLTLVSGSTNSSPYQQTFFFKLVAEPTPGVGGGGGGVQLVANTTDPSGNEMLVDSVGTETLVPGCNLTAPGSPTVAIINWNIWISVNAPGQTKITTMRVRRTGLAGAILATQNLGDVGSDSAAGHLQQFSGSFIDTAVTDGVYVVTVQQVWDTGGDVWSDTRSFSILSQ